MDISASHIFPSLAKFGQFLAKVIPLKFLYGMICTSQICGMLPKMLFLFGSNYLVTNQWFLNPFKIIQVSVDFTTTLAIAIMEHECSLEKLYFMYTPYISYQKIINLYILLLKSTQSVCTIRTTKEGFFRAVEEIISQCGPCIIPILTPLIVINLFSSPILEFITFIFSIFGSVECRLWHAKPAIAIQHPSYPSNCFSSASAWFAII